MWVTSTFIVCHIRHTRGTLELDQGVIVSYRSVLAKIRYNLSHHLISKRKQLG